MKPLQPNNQAHPSHIPKPPLQCLLLWSPIINSHLDTPPQRAIKRELQFWFASSWYSKIFMFAGFCCSFSMAFLFPIPNHPINLVAAMTRIVHYKYIRQQQQWQRHQPAIEDIQPKSSKSSTSSAHVCLPFYLRPNDLSRLLFLSTKPNNSCNLP